MNEELPHIETEKEEDFRRASTALRTSILAQATQRWKSEDRYELLSFYLDLARDLTFALVLDHTHDLAHARVHVLDRVLVRTLTRVRARDLDHVHALNLALDLVRTLDLALTLVHVRDLDRDRDLARALVHARDLVLDQAFALTLDRAFAFTLDLARARTLDSSILYLDIGRLITRSIILLLDVEKPPKLAENTSLHFRFTLEGIRGTNNGFSPDYLVNTIIPYVSALTALQHVIDEIHNRSPSQIKVLGIRYGSVSIDATDDIRETVELVLDIVVPWRRENKMRLFELETHQKELELKQKEVVVEQSKVALSNESTQSDDKTRLLRVQTHKQELENQKTQLKIMKLVLEIIDKVKTDLPEDRRLFYALKVLDPARILATSPLELTAVEMIEDSNTSTDKGKEQAVPSVRSAVDVLEPDNTDEEE